MKRKHIGALTRVCVVGGGQMGRLYEELVRSIKSVTEVCIVEPGAINQDFIDRNIVIYRSIDELDMSAFNMFCICTPTQTHAELIKKILSGTDDAIIMCEKPLARNSDEINELLAEFPAINTRLVCGLVEHFNHPNIEAYTWFKNTPDSTRVKGRLSRRTKKPQTGWALDHSKSGGILLDLTIHDIDFVLWLHGYENVVVESAASFDDSIEIVLRSGNASYTIHSGWDIPPESKFGILSSIELSAGEDRFTYDSQTETIVINGVVSEAEPRFPYAYQREIMAAADMRNTRNQRFPDARQCLRVIALIEDVETLIRKGAEK